MAVRERLIISPKRYKMKSVKITLQFWFFCPNETIVNGFTDYYFEINYEYFANSFELCRFNYK
jgi:hypothetical protein